MEPINNSNELVEENEDTKNDPLYDTKFQKLRSLITCHRVSVQSYMQGIARDLTVRGRRHDNSIMIDEFESSKAISSVNPFDDGQTKGLLQHLYLNPDFVKSHCSNNDHHPDHFEDDGIAGMNLMQLTEMLCDMMVRAEELDVSYDYMVEQLCCRYTISSDLHRILSNTIHTMMEDKRYGTIQKQKE